MGYTPHVLVVGGGPLGAALARDFAIRGLEVTLVDSGPLADPRLGRMGGLLASGAQFARQDPAYAKRCLAENRTLFEIADHCVEDTGGFVVGEDLDTLQAACEDCSIAARRLSESDLREREPELADGLDGALAVPDAAIDPSLLTVATVRDAHEYGADIRPWTEVRDIGVENGAVDTVILRYDPLGQSDDRRDTGQGENSDGNGPARDDADGDGSTSDDSDSDRPDGDDPDGEDPDGEDPDGEDRDGEDAVRSDGGTSLPGASGDSPGGQSGGAQTVEPSVDRLDVDYVVNAAGTDASAVAALADCSVPVTQERTTTVVQEGQPVETAVTRPVETESPPASIVPVGQHTLLADGRTSDDDRSIPDPSAVDSVGESLADLLPAGTAGRAMRAFREPRYDAGEGRDFAVFDHDRQGCWGLLTVLGGTVTTHRWVAEKVCDRVCGEFGIRRACQTDELLLPGSENVPDLAQAVGTFGLAEAVYEQSKRRLGSQANAVLHTDGANPVLCPCQSVTRAEVRAALDDDTSAGADLAGVRVRTAATTGPCQGGRCAHRLAAELHPDYETDVVERACAALLEERWRGQRPVTGPQQTEMARSYRLHAATMNRGRDHDLGHEDLAAFDDDIPETTDRPTCCPRVGWER